MCNYIGVILWLIVLLYTNRYYPFSLCFTVGRKAGLTLVLNVEQYEYMKGPQDDAGVKVLFPNQ